MRAAGVRFLRTMEITSLSHRPTPLFNCRGMGMKVTSNQITMLARIIEGDAEKFLSSVGVTDPFDQGYAKEALFLNLLANVLIYRTVLDRDRGTVRPEDMNERLMDRMEHVKGKLQEVVQFHADLHAKKAKERP